MTYKITNTSELRTITAQTCDALGMSVDPNDTADVIAKINLLTMLLGTSCQAIALAQKLYDKKMLDLMSEPKWAKFPPFEKKLVFDGLARNETYYVKLTENQHHALINSIYGLRTLIYP